MKFLLLNFGGFNTTDAREDIPQLEEIYGKDMPIDLHFSMVKAPIVMFFKDRWDSPQRMVGRADVDAKWVINGKEAFTVRSSLAEFGFELSIRNFTLTFQLTTFYVDRMTVLDSHIGKPDPDFQALANLIDISSDVALSMINSLIPRIKLPKGIDSETKFKQIILQERDGYVYLELGFEAVKTLYEAF